MGIFDFNKINAEVCGTGNVLNALQSYNTVVLKPHIVDNRNILTGNMLRNANTKYVIRWDYDLAGETITMQPGCIIEFDGGSIKNGTLVGNNTVLLYYQELNAAIKDSVELQGTFIYNNGNEIADEEDITTVNNRLKFKDKDYAPNDYSGLGRVYLRKNLVDVPHICQVAACDHDTIYDGNGDLPHMYGHNAFKLNTYDIDIAADEYTIEFSGEDETFYYIVGTPDGSGNYNYDVDAAQSGTLSDVAAHLKQIHDDYVVLVWLDNKSAAGTTLTVTDGSVDKKNVLTQEMLNKADTIYHIQYDYDLNDPNGEHPITVPEGCVLQFDGGSLRNGTIVGQNTGIDAGLVKIFDTDVILDGAWNVSNWNVNWFGAVGDNETSCSQYFQKCIDTISSLNNDIMGYGYSNNAIYIPVGIYLIDSSINCPQKLSIKGSGNDSVIKCSADGAAFVFLASSSNININNITFWGKGANAKAVELTSSSASMHITNCTFSGFYIALDLTKPYWGRITDCNFFYSKLYDIHCIDANDFSIVNCNFRVLDSKPLETHIVFEHNMLGLNIVGCDFSGGYGASILFNACIGWGVSITGNYFEPGISNAYACPVIKTVDGVLNDFVFTGNSVYEGNGGDYNATKRPRYFIYINNTALLFSNINANIVYDDTYTLKGRANTGVVSIYKKSQFNNDNINLIDDKIAKTAELNNLTPGTQEYEDKLNTIIDESGDIVDVLTNNNNTDDLIINGNSNIRQCFSAIISKITNNFYKLSPLESGNINNRPSIREKGFNYYDTDIAQPITWNGNKWVNALGFTAGYNKGSSTLRKTRYDLIPISNSDKGYLFFDTTLNTYVIARSVSNNSVKWVDMSGFSAYPHRGTTSQRPTAEYTDGEGTFHDGLIRGESFDYGFLYYDIDIKRPIFVKSINYNSSVVNWMDAQGFTPHENSGAVRPSDLSASTDVGLCFFDTTLGKPIYFNGTDWVDSNGFSPCYKKGDTENRPQGTAANVRNYLDSINDRGFEYFDLTLGKPIYAKNISPSTGAVQWVDATGNWVDTMYNVTYNLTHLTASNPKAIAGITFDTKLTADTGYSLPASASDITIVIGGTTLVSPTDFTYDPETGVIIILGTLVTGDITITA